MIKPLIVSFIVLLFLLLFTEHAFAQNADSDLKIVKTSSEDAKILKETKPQGPHEIPVPQFILKSNDSNFFLTIGGIISPVMGWDIGNNLYNATGSGLCFITNSIPVPAIKGHKADYYINPLNGAVDLQVVGLAGTKNQITGYIKVGTNGSNCNLCVTKAYITWKKFTGGLKNTLMQDANACQPSTIDPEGPSGCISNSSYEINYVSPSYKGFSFAAAIDMPTFYSSNGYYQGKDYPIYDNKQVASNEYADAEQLIPDIPAWIQYQFSPNNRIRLSGLIRNFAYRDLVADKTRHVVGWGSMLSGNIQPCNLLILYYQCAYGAGIGRYVQDIAGLPLSFVPENSNPGKMKASPMMGVNFGATLNISSNLQFNIMGSECRIWGVESQCTAADATCNYKYALYGAVNAFYNITPYLQWGIEYIWGRLKTWNIGGANDNRIQTQIMFTL